MKKFIAFIVLAFALTACGGGGSSSAEESFVSGDGSTTFIKSSDRKIAPAITGMTLSGKNYTYEKDRVAVVNVWASLVLSMSRRSTNTCRLSQQVHRCCIYWNLDQR